MLHFVWKLWDKSATGVIKVEAIQLVWGPVIYPLFPCQLSSSSLSVVIFIDRRREPRQKKSLQRRACGPGLFYLCLNPIQVRYFSFSWVLIELSIGPSSIIVHPCHLLTDAPTIFTFFWDLVCVTPAVCWYQRITCWYQCLSR